MDDSVTLHKQKLQAKIDGWSADLDKLKAVSSELSADGQLALKDHVDAISGKLDEAKTTLAGLVDGVKDAAAGAVDKAKDAAEAVGDKASDLAEDKEAYKAQLKAKLDEWAGDIEKLKERSADLGDDAKAAIQEQIDAMEGKLSEGRSELDKLADAADDVWDSVKDKTQSMFASLKSAVGSVVDKVRG